MLHRSGVNRLSMAWYGVRGFCWALWLVGCYWRPVGWTAANTRPSSPNLPYPICSRPQQEEDERRTSTYTGIQVESVRFGHVEPVLDTASQRVQFTAPYADSARFCCVVSCLRRIRTCLDLQFTQNSGLHPKTKAPRPFCLGALEVQVRLSE